MSPYPGERVLGDSPIFDLDGTSASVMGVVPSRVSPDPRYPWVRSTVHNHVGPGLRTGPWRVTGRPALWDPRR